MKAPHPSTAPEPEAQAVAEAESTPPPEPWTAERVLAWNAYYDLYVAAGVLLMAFLTSAVMIGNAAIWTHVRAGQLILRRGPLTTDPFSYTVPGLRWVDIPWLFQAAMGALYNLGAVIVPGETAAELARADRIGSYALVAANALVRVLTAWLVLGLRRPGPGAWWVAVCAAVGVGVLTGPAPLAPETWGFLLLAAELFLIHRASTGGRAWAWALVPLFILWANVDETFILGLLILAVAAAGSAGRRASAWTPGLALPVLGASLTAALVNPSTFRAYLVAGRSLAAMVLRPAEQRLIPLELAFRTRSLDALWFFDGTFLIVLALGLASFAVNRDRFSRPRFLIFAVSALLGEVFYPYRGAFALVAAATLATNGQEWYQGKFGTEGRLGTGWAIWSVGGRAVTIVGLFAAIALAITGYRAQPGDLRFGFGYDPDDFAFESAEFLARTPIRGHILNTNPPLGDALIWKARSGASPRPTFVDSRPGVFPPEVVADLQAARGGLSKDDPALWRPVLDKYGIDVVMISRNDPRDTGLLATLGDPSIRTHAVLNASKDWIPFYDDGNVALFGRRDGAPAEDLAYFEAQRLDPQGLAFRREIPTRSTQEPPPIPQPTDRYFRARSLTRPQPHVRRAQDWLLSGSPAAPNEPPDLARCLLAVREARAAIAARPDDAAGYAILADAYRSLSAREAGLMGSAGATSLRIQQRITALNFAIQAAPPPVNAEARELLRRMNLELAQLYDVIGAYDLERDRLAKAREYGDAEDFGAEAVRRLEQLDAAIAEARAQMDEVGAEGQGTPGPIARANLAQQRGMIGMAIAELKDVEAQGLRPEAVRARLVDLYCQVGQADKAQELVGGPQSSLEDPSLETEPGMGYYRHARIFLLMGDYGSARALYSQAIARLRSNTIRMALDTASSSTFPMGGQTGTLQGNFPLATRLAMEMPAQVATEASWESELGLLLLEAGDPRGAGDELTQALTLNPDLSLRPLAAYLLEQIGVPVPPPRSPTPDPSAPAGALPEDVFAR